MLMQRILGALTFNGKVYKEVEQDQSFTSTAWILVVVTAFLNQLGSQAGADGFFKWLIAAVVMTVVSVVGFALVAFIVSFAAKNLFNADVTFDELVRCLGLAYIWNAVGILGIFGGIFSFLACLAGPIVFLAWILGFVSWLIALKEAVDLDWGLTIVLAIIAFIINIIIGIIGMIIVGVFGISAGILHGMFTG